MFNTTEDFESSRIFQSECKESFFSVKFLSHDEGTGLGIIVENCSLGNKDRIVFLVDQNAWHCLLMSVAKLPAH